MSAIWVSRMPTDTPTDGPVQLCNIMRADNVRIGGNQFHVYSSSIFNRPEMGCRRVHAKLSKMHENVAKSWNVVFVSFNCSSMPCNEALVDIIQSHHFVSVVIPTVHLYSPTQNSVASGHYSTLPKPNVVLIDRM